MDSLQKSELKYDCQEVEKQGLLFGQECLTRGLKKAAIKVYEALLDLFPRSVPGRLILGATYHDNSEDDKALAEFDKVIKLHPYDAYAHYYKAFVLLAAGKLYQGFDEYLWRYKRHGLPKTLHTAWPRVEWWDAQDLTGKRIIVWTEQGVGDEILLASMLPDLIEMKAHVILCCTERIRDLLKPTYPQIEYALRCRDAAKIVEGYENIRADYKAGLSELGAYLRPDMESFPKRDTYLRCDPDVTYKLRAKYRNGGRQPIIGISWESKNPQVAKDKSSSLLDWTRVLSIPGLTFVNLQFSHDKHIVKSVSALTRANIITDPDIDSMVSLVDYANQVAACDLVLTVSNTTAHVAGALGIPVWNIVPNNKGRCWYWFRDRTDSPWYPSMTIIRNTEGMHEAIEKIEGTLKAFMEHYEHV